jgi:hypothetical protein
MITTHLVLLPILIPLTGATVALDAGDDAHRIC